MERYSLSERAYMHVRIASRCILWGLVSQNKFGWSNLKRPTKAVILDPWVTSESIYCLFDAPTRPIKPESNIIGSPRLKWHNLSTTIFKLPPTCMCAGDGGEEADSACLDSEVCWDKLPCSGETLWTQGGHKSTAIKLSLHPPGSETQPGLPQCSPPAPSPEGFSRPAEGI